MTADKHNIDMSSCCVRCCGRVQGYDLLPQVTEPSIKRDITRALSVARDVTQVLTLSHGISSAVAA
jgi:hypothetical protein